MSFERFFGWVILAFYVAGFLGLLEWLESVDVPNFVIAIAFFPIGWGAWLGASATRCSVFIVSL
mgnify:CR=1 FL=1